MENWDEEKLRTVVLSKSGNPRTTTDVCTIPMTYSDSQLILSLCHRLSANFSSKQSRRRSTSGSSRIFA